MSTYSEVVTNNTVLSSVASVIGRVKWFNNKVGYGFITITDGVYSGQDIFVHHSAIKVENQQYRYLVQGEYVEFNLVKSTEGKYEYQAQDVNGIKSGKLMCETRHEFKQERSKYRSNENVDLNTTSNVQIDTSLEVNLPRQLQNVPKTPRARNNVPKDSVKGEWTEVSKTTRKPSNKKPVSKVVNK